MVQFKIFRTTDRLKKKKFVKCPEGVDTLQDLLHIFRQICGIKNKRDRSKGIEENQDENQSKGINAVDTKPIRGVPTMTQAVSIIIYFLLNIRKRKLILISSFLSLRK